MLCVKCLGFANNKQLALVIIEEEQIDFIG
jgi:hypothetical protein